MSGLSREKIRLKSCCAGYVDVVLKVSYLLTLRYAYQGQGTIETGKEAHSGSRHNLHSKNYFTKNYVPIVKKDLRSA